jgi:hypothetical protein
MRFCRLYSHLFGFYLRLGHMLVAALLCSAVGKSEALFLRCVAFGAINSVV